MEYLDSEGKKLKKGFYRPRGSDNLELLYFTGNYENDGRPIIQYQKQDSHGDLLNGNRNLEEKYLKTGIIKNLIKVTEEEVRRILFSCKLKAEWFGKRSKWLEEKLKE